MSAAPPQSIHTSPGTARWVIVETTAPYGGGPGYDGPIWDLIDDQGVGRDIDYATKVDAEAACAALNAAFGTNGPLPRFVVEVWREADALVRAAGRFAFDLTYTRAKTPRRFGRDGLSGDPIDDAFDSDRKAAGGWEMPDWCAEERPEEEWLEAFFGVAINEAVHEALEYARVDGQTVLNPHGRHEREIHRLVDQLAEQLWDLAHTVDDRVVAHTANDPDRADADRAIPDVASIRRRLAAARNSLHDNDPAWAVEVQRGAGPKKTLIVDAADPHGGVIAHHVWDDDAAHLIANAPADIAYLINDRDRLRAELERANARIARLEAATTTSGGVGAVGAVAGNRATTDG